MILAFKPNLSYFILNLQFTSSLYLVSLMGWFDKRRDRILFLQYAEASESWIAPFYSRREIMLWFKITATDKLTINANLIVSVL